MIYYVLGPSRCKPKTGQKSTFILCLYDEMFSILINLRIFWWSIQKDIVLSIFNYRLVFIDNAICYFMKVCLFFPIRLELEFEPLFATMALYDAKEKKKVTACIRYFRCVLYIFLIKVNDRFLVMASQCYGN